MDKFFGLDKVNPPMEGFELLVTVTDRIQLAIIEGTLKEFKVPYFCKDKGCGSAVKAITGFSMFGADIFVHESDYERAFELINSVSSDNAEIISEENDD